MNLILEFAAHSCSCSIGGVLSVTISGLRYLKNITNGDVKQLQLNEVSEVDKEAMAERRKSKSSQKDELFSESGESKLIFQSPNTQPIDNESAIRQRALPLRPPSRPAAKPSRSAPSYSMKRSSSGRAKRSFQHWTVPTTSSWTNSDLSKLSVARASPQLSMAGKQRAEAQALLRRLPQVR